ncbi:hypothetical protein A2U01_0058940, partial [Trifolium medium]|nr:hypothetical protein [Trifolium medium]
MTDPAWWRRHGSGVVADNIVPADGGCSKERER